MPRLSNPVARLRRPDRIVARAVRLRRARGRGRDAGMTTAEYAVGTVAACGFGGLLFKIVTSESVANMLRHLIERALTLSF